MKNWSPERIRAEFALKKRKQATVAKKAGVSRTQIGRVIDGGPSDRVRRIIADELGHDVREIWPEIYLADSLTA